MDDTKHSQDNNVKQTFMDDKKIIQDNNIVLSNYVYRHLDIILNFEFA